MQYLECHFTLSVRVAYTSPTQARTLSPSEKKWGSTRRELTGVAFALSRWHSLLKGRKFDLYVDNHALLYLKSKEKIDNAILNVYETIYEIDFTITYCKGIDNILADRLSRIFVPNDTKMLKGGDDSRKRKKFVSNKENESSLTIGNEAIQWENVCSLQIEKKMNYN